MAGRPFRIMAALGIACCLVTGSGQAFATPTTQPDAAAVTAAASPEADEPCGALTAGVAHPTADTILATGGVQRACSGWTRLCVTLWQTGATSPVARSTQCTPLSAGESVTINSGAVPCVSGWYYGRTTAYAGNPPVRQTTSPIEHIRC